MDNNRNENEFSNFLDVKFMDFFKEYKMPKLEIKTLQELEDIVERYKAGEDDKEDYMKENGKFYSAISSGIVPKEIPYKEEITNNIINYFKDYNLSEDEIRFRINRIKISFSDVLVLTGKSAWGYSSGRSICIDYRLAKFSEEGHIIGIKDEKKDFYIHVLTHEMLHNLSNINIKDSGLEDNGFNEGYTDMLAHLISKTNTVSERYCFVEKVCMLFTEIIGIEKTINDYFNNVLECPNLQELFKECECDQFMEFSVLLSSVISTFDSEKNKKEKNLTRIKQYECLKFIIEKILHPYLTKYSDRKVELLDKFNQLFNEFGYSFDAENIKFSSNRIK